MKILETNKFIEVFLINPSSVRRRSVSDRILSLANVSYANNLIIWLQNNQK